MTKPIKALLPKKPEKRLRIYAYAIDAESHRGHLKVGQTTGSVQDRIRSQLRTANIKPQILLDEPADREDGSTFSDHDVRRQLQRRGFSRVDLQWGREWMECAVKDVRTAIHELRTGQHVSGAQHLDFSMRAEQREAVNMTHRYYKSVWAEDPSRVPRFLWNAKMRFGKTFTTYQLAKRMAAQRVLVLTFKPAVEDAWRSDLQSHVDFTEWQYYSKDSETSPHDADPDKPLVYFGSFQDLLGRDKYGNIKPKNEWVHEINWGLVVFDEYHFGAWRDSAQELFEGEDHKTTKKELKAEGTDVLETFSTELEELSVKEADFLPITTGAYLYLSGTPFKALATGEFIEEQIFNWTYTDEQRSKQEFAEKVPEEPNPYASLPEMRLLTYQMPDELLAVASQGEFDEFDLNAFFEASGTGDETAFKHKNDVQKWLDIIRGKYDPRNVDHLKTGTRPPLPYSDTRLLPYLRHSFWFLPTVASCEAMRNLLAEPQNSYWHQYQVLSVAGPGAGIGVDALPPVRKAIGNGHDTKTITLSCGKLTTGVTVKQWSSILMLRNLKSPETYFQAAFRVQSPWTINNPEGDDPLAEETLKPVCYVFDFAPTRALRQVSDYGVGLSPEARNPEEAVEQLVNFLPILAYDGSKMIPVDAAGVLDIAMSGTTATLLARRWESAMLVNVDNLTLRKIMDNQKALDAIMRIEGFRALGNNVFETVVNKSETVSQTKKDKGESLSKGERQSLSEEEKEYKSKRKQIQEKLVKFATRIPAFMYLTDYRENTLMDVIQEIEPELFQAVTGLSLADFRLLVQLNVFNAAHMNQAVFAFRRYEDASLSYTGIESHPNLRHYGLYDTVVTAREVQK